MIDPRQPGRFVLGVECDGATYHSARSARDRDRLRHEVLVGLGWRLHRIWSTDWFRSPQREVARLLAAIEHACSSAPPPTAPVPVPPPITEETPNLASVEPTAASRELPAYEECQLSVSTQQDLLTLQPFEIPALTAFVVKAEGPIHTEEVARRIREAFGLQRTGNRILSKIDEALRTAARLGEVSSVEGFWATREPGHPLPRHRRDAALPLRRADRIAPEEYRLAILQVVEAAVGIGREDLIVETARLMGFDRTGTDLHKAIDKQISLLLKSDRIQSENERIYLRSPPPPSNGLDRVPQTAKV